ncbi:MAG: DMT family transporter [Myxococcaceae bacterium]
MGDRTAERVGRAAPRVYGAILLQTVISAFTYLAAARAMRELSPATVLVVRVGLSALIFAAILALTPGPKLPPRGALVTVAFFGFLAGPLNQGLFLAGLQRSRPVHAALLYALTPVGVYLVMLASRRERPSWRRLWGIVLAFAGVTVLLTGHGLREALAPLLGDLFILGGVAAWVLYTTEGSRFAAVHGPIRTTAWSMIAAALWSLPAVPFVLEPGKLFTASAVALSCVAFLVVFTSVVAYLLWYYALTKLEPSRVAVFANLQPVVTALGAWALFHERLVWEVYVGGALVLAGVRFAQRQAPPAQPPVRPLADSAP